MSTNRQLAEVFTQMALALELTGANAFRVNAHNRAARVCADLTDDLAQLVEREGDDAAQVLSAIDGIGKATASKIIEFVRTGEVKEHGRLMNEVPAGLFDVLAVPGLGPKTVKLMWDELGIVDLQGVKNAIEDDSILTLPRMGAKTVANITDAITFMETAGDRTRIGIALPLAEALVETMSQVKGVKRIQYAGSLRRGTETIGDIDLLITSADPLRAAEAFRTLPGVNKVLASGETKSSVRMSLPDGGAIQVDLRIVEQPAYEAALMYFTGSKQHNIRMRQRAIDRGLRLNEYGLFPEPPDPDAPPQKQNVTPVALTEQAIYEALDLPWIPPELREESVKLDGFDAAALIDLGDITSDLHTHTTASDGSMSIDQLADLAVAHGYHTVAVTDHSVSQPIANGLSADRLREHIQAIRTANERRSDITILAGSEVDILADGRLDYDDDLLAELDIVIASPHSALRQEPKAATSRLLRAITHPLVHIIGHPTGRYIGKRPGLSPDMPTLFAAAAEHDTALEVNAHWSRLDLRDTHIRAAAAAGSKLSINTDAHHADGMDVIRYGILAARRAGLDRDACINTWSAEALRTWLTRKR
ncbi:MAG: DNA polymerase/3'-5' exonuclease PolX [Phycisphaerales bacterium]|nr:DNA polymerase/3'-5' exonuclease PolX [Phycisphaerales bacterium]